MRKSSRPEQDQQQTKKKKTMKWTISEYLSDQKVKITYITNFPKRFNGLKKKTERGIRNLREFLKSKDNRIYFRNDHRQSLKEY